MATPSRPGPTPCDADASKLGDSGTTRLTIAARTLPSADLYAPSPLVPVADRTDLHQVVIDGGLDDEMAANIGYGRVAHIAPYLPQDRYDRTQQPRAHRVAVLTNGILRAEFLLDLGARLWSLRHLPTNRALVHENPVIQPANLALRDAWFAGGIEWNIGTIGHTPLTCEPLHAIRVVRADGNEALRVYEFERLRGLVYEIEFSLDDAVLLVSTRVTNPGEWPVPMYWWSNIAVPQAAGARIIAPARTAWNFGYAGTLAHLPFPAPVAGASDESFPTSASYAADWFIDIDSSASDMPWIAAVEADGTGVLQRSTAELRGRKLFVWGTGLGGQRWQEWLSDGQHPYAEIQAGLARTQLEHVPMPGATTWRWVEGYTALTMTPEAVAGSWDAAVQAVAASLSAEALAHAIATERVRDDANDRLAERIGRGSGWGALEALRRDATGAERLGSARTPFPVADLGPDQAYWFGLLGPRGAAARDARAADARCLALADVSMPTVCDPEVVGAREVAAAGTTDAVQTHLGAFRSWMRDAAWLPFLEARTDADAALHRAHILHWRGDADAARSLAQHAAEAAHPSHIATRWAAARLCAVLASDATTSVRHILEAAHCALRVFADDPGLERAAFAECVDALLDADHPTEALAHLEAYAARTGGDPSDSLRLLEARARLRLGDAAACLTLLDAITVLPNVREGTDLFADLWLDAHASRLQANDPGLSFADARTLAQIEHPIPVAFNFAMRPRT